MASEKATRKDTTEVSTKQEHHEEPRVAKLATHFESLAEKANQHHSHTEKIKEPHTGKERDTMKKACTDQEHVQSKSQFDDSNISQRKQHQKTQDDSATKIQQKQKTTTTQGEGPHDQGALEEIGKHRQQAQQNSMEAIRGAEERYDKETKKESHHVEDVKNSLSFEEVGQYRQQAQQNSMEAIRAAEERYEKAKLNGVGKAVVDLTVETGVKAKDVAVSTGSTAVHYVGEKTVDIKDTALDVSKRTVNYAGEKVVAAKDVTLEASKKGLGYAGQKSSEAKQAAVDTTRSAMEQTSKKLEESNKPSGGTEKASSKLTETNKYPGAERGTEEKDKGPEKHVEGIQETEEEIEVGPAQLLGAVGETLAEIAKNAKEMVVGPETELEQHKVLGDVELEHQHHEHQQ
ncbi:hypothetical protein MKW92_051257 [Papaver armeniacum]|nr:hypothetical protein MKW92_051257 [Papaver armeniacum]